MRISALMVLGFVALWTIGPLHAQYSAAESNWRKSISAQVNGQKGFPADYSGNGGTTKLTCTIERSGKLKSVEIKTSSGSKALDEKALDMFQRAQPFQPAPDEAKGESFTFSLDIRFAAQHQPVDVELVIAAEVSFSMSGDDLVLRRDAYAQAIVSSEFALALKAGRLGKLAVTYFEWSASNHQEVIVPWRVIDGPEAAAALAAEISDIRSATRARTSISSALDLAVTLFKDRHSEGARRVLDISGDGPNNNGGPVLAARDAALAEEITVNGVTIMYPGPSRPQTDIDRLDDYYADCVTGGQGSFVLAVKSRADLKETIRNALVSDIAGRVPERAQTPPAGQEKRVSCRKGEEALEKVWIAPPAKTAPAMFAISQCFERLKLSIKNPVDLSATIGTDGMIVGSPKFVSPIKIDDVRADVNAATRILRECQPYVIYPAEGARRQVSQVFRFGDAKLTSESIAEAVRANFRTCWKPARTGPTVWMSLDYKPDGTYRSKPMLINPQDTEEYSRAAASITTQISKCPPVKFPQGMHPVQSIQWEFLSDESARSSRPRT